MEHTPARPDEPAIQQRDIGQILGAAFDLYRAHWQTLAGVAAVIVVPVTLLQYAVQHGIRGSRAIVTTNPGGIVVHASAARQSAAAALFGLLAFFAYFLLTGAITRAVASETAGMGADVGESYRYGAARFGSILWVALLSGLAVVAGFILFVIPGFIVLTRLVGAMPALVVEDKRGTAALSRSWDLVRGRSWPVFGAIILVALMVGAVSSVITLPFNGAWFAQAVAAAVASTFTLPYSVLVGVLLYVDVRTRKEELTRSTLQEELRASAG